MKKTLWQRIKENVGFIGGIVSLLWWLGVTPEMVGQVVYDIGYYTVPLVMIASGISIGWTIRESIDDRAVEALKIKHETEIEALKSEHKTAMEDIESKIGMTVEEAAEKLEYQDSLIENLYKQAADSEQPILRGEEALDFIASLPENQRQLLQDIYDADGSFEADPFDAELSSMAHYGLVLRPAAFYPGEPATWILPPNINRIIHDYPMILDGQDAVESKRQLNEDMREIETLSQGQAAVVWMVYAHGGSIVLSSLGYRSVEVRARSDVFVVTKTEDDAVSYVHLTPEWNRLMHDRWDEFLDHFKLERPPVFE